ncbi:hypothetical protein CC202_09565 [Pseudomonas savastanoi]|uniref:ParB/RepB/Spo0J family partition protein n=1 Tax=Pseudomonas savastanoi TaxID=29438 RepID=UPI000BA470F0|nr:ParB/RepB/Spo0J family partition protein [Pseudomonas savastanoi]PAB33125.1 hypothetical protein CC202_09565 [Pseudomonas savastanoi]
MAKKGLGLDLTDMANFQPTVQPVEPIVVTGALEVPLEDVIPDPGQPRKKFDPVKLQKLADVIKGSQLNQPISVQPKNAEGKYVINIGERRWRACKLAGLATVPVMISDKTDPYDQVTENTEREPLTTMEVADFIARQVEKGDKKGYIAKRLGMRADAVSQHLALATAPAFIQNLGNDTEIGARTLYELVQAHKEFPGEIVEYVSQEEEITRGGLATLLLRLRAKQVATTPPPVEPGPSVQPPANEETKPPKEPGQAQDPQTNQAPQVQSPGTSEPKPSSMSNTVRLMVDGREATLAPVGLVSVVYADTGEVCEVDLTTVQVIRVEELGNENS